MATLKDIQKYQKEDGFYDVQAIVDDEGKHESGSVASTFAAFFGGEDVDADEASEFVKLARFENERIAAEQAKVEEAEAEEAYKRVIAGEDSNADRQLLVSFGWAQNNYRGGSNRPTSITITRHDPPSDKYADQAGIEENPPG